MEEEEFLVEEEEETDDEACVKQSELRARCDEVYSRCAEGFAIDLRSISC